MKTIIADMGMISVIIYYFLILYIIIVLEFDKNSFVDINIDLKL
jgi:hypothetical protein